MHTIYLVPHSHYDAVWAFTKEDYLYINIEQILKQAVDLMEKSDYRFLIEQTALLEEIERRNPSLFAELVKFIRQGKMEIAPGEYLMSDTMIPSGETLVRGILYGKRYIKEKADVDVPVMWGADSFGYNAQLPQIYTKSGYRYFAFRRGANKDRPTEFWWQGLDGTRILTHWMHLGYRAGLDLTDLEESFNELRAVAATSHILMPSGSGSIPPQPETGRVVRKWNRTHHDSEMVIAGPTAFFTALEKEAKNLKVMKGELYSGRYSQVFPYTCSSRMWVKQDMRRYEHLILSCEKWLTVAWLLGVPYPADELRDNWKKVLWGAFHDVVPGTGMDEGYEEAKNNFSYLQVHLSQILSNFLTVIAKNLQTADEIVIFNPLSWGVKNWVEVDLGFERGRIKRIAGLRSGTEEIEVEILEFLRYKDDSYQTAKIGFVATVPAFGFRTYKILRRNPKGQTGPRIKTNGPNIENQFFRVRVDPSSGLVDVYQSGKHLVWGNELMVEEETGDLYYHRQNLEQAFKTESDEGVTFGKFRMKNFKTTKTPLRRVIEVESDYYSMIWPYRLLDKLRPVLWRHNFISISKKIVVYNDIPRIDFFTTINNHHPQMRMRVRFATDIRSPEYQSEIQFGVISRPVDQYYSKPRGRWVERPCGVYPALNWVDYSDKERGVTLINRGIPGHEIRDDAIYLTLLRSVHMLSADGVTGPAIPTPDAQEFKTYTFEYSLFPHQKGWKASNAFQPAYEFNYNLMGFQLPVVRGTKTFPYQTSFVDIKPNNLILVAFKKAEGDDEVIMRFFETKGERTRGQIFLFRQPSSVKRANLLEEEQEEIKHRGRRVRLEVKPFEIVTLKISF
jgi:alpha-mannosidase